MKALKGLCEAICALAYIYICEYFVYITDCMSAAAAAAAAASASATVEVDLLADVSI